MSQKRSLFLAFWWGASGDFKFGNPVLMGSSPAVLPKFTLLNMLSSKRDEVLRSLSFISPPVPEIVLLGKMVPFFELRVTRAFCLIFGWCRECQAARGFMTPRVALPNY